MKKEKEYRRLPGRGYKKDGAFLSVARTSATLWEGKDHLLCLYNTRYVEKYKRFYYKDIQAIVTNKNNKWARQNTLALLFIILFATPPIFLDDPWKFIFWPMAAILLIYLPLNLLKGPTCDTFIQTAVNKEEIPSLNRLRISLKVIDRLKPKIEEAQGKLSSEDLQHKFPELIHAVSAAGQQVKPPESGYKGKLHEALFYLLLSGGIFSATELFINNIIITIFDTLFFLTSVVILVMALTRQQNSVKKEVKAITWVSLGYVCTSFIIGNILNFLIIVKNPEIANDQWEIMKQFAEMSAAENPFLKGTLIFSIISSFTLGLSGLYFLRSRQPNADVSYK